MATEIERKFVAAQIPDPATLGEGEPLRQGYLAEEGDTAVRVRITPDAATLTVKAGTGLSRTEVEVPISRADADALWAHTAGRRIDKTRHRVRLGDGAETGLVAEVDVYAGELAGLCTVEVEFDSVGDAEAFVAPPWFGTDVTDEPGWTNAALARRGRPH
jgi:adenylate cyclase